MGLFHFSTVVWGPWHTQVYLDLNLPSLLTSGNLTAFAARHQVTYRILTSSQDAERIAAAPAYQRASAIVPMELVACVGDHPADPIALHHALWRRSIEEARAAGAMILFVPPDVVWSSNAFGHVAELAAAGKRAIFITYLRVVEETCGPEVRRLFGDPARALIDAPSRALVDLAMRHIHPLALTYMRDSPNFPTHPELIFWPAAREGLLMRVLVREMFAYDPRLIDLNQQALAAHRVDPDLVHYITDSDDLFSLSLAPAAKDIEWYIRPQRLEALKVASWWLAYDSPLNDRVAAERFYIHGRDRDPLTWRRAERESDALMDRLAGMREVLRVLGQLTRRDCEQARRLIAMALATTKLARVLRPAGPLTLLLPRNQAVLRWLLDGGDALLQPGRSRGLIDLVLQHAFVGRHYFQPGDNAQLQTLSGAARSLSWRGEAALVDGVAVRWPGFALGEHWAYVAEDVLRSPVPLEIERLAGGQPRALRHGAAALPADGDLVHVAGGHNEDAARAPSRARLGRPGH
jgi:hypothetical protein